jgi:actin-related protein
MFRRIGMSFGNSGKRCSNCGTQQNVKHVIQTVGGRMQQEQLQRAQIQRNAVMQRQNYLRRAQEAEQNRHRAQEAEQNRHRAQEAEQNRHRAQEAQQNRQRAQEAEKNRQRAQEAEKNRQRAQEAEKNRQRAQEAEKNRQRAQEAEKNRHRAQEAEQNRHRAQEAEKNRQRAQEAQQNRQRAQEAAIARRTAQVKQSRPSRAIHVYGADWCGFTRKQNTEIKEALKNDPHAKDKHIIINCPDQPNNKVCKDLKAFPLTVIHTIGEEYSLAEVEQQHKPGYRSGTSVVAELEKALAGQRAPAPVAPAPAPVASVPAPVAPAPVAPTPVQRVGGQAIHVYGAEWCGFTKRQNKEIKEALEKDPQGGNALVYIDCAGEGKSNPVCVGMPGFPLTVVHERGKKYTLQELMKIKPPGYRAGAVVVNEWKEACGKAPTKNNVQFEINSSAELKTKAIHVYGANWCGFTRSQISELKETLKHETGGLESLHVHECAGGDLSPDVKQICGGLQGYPLTIVSDKDGPKEVVAEVLKKHRLGKRPAVDVVSEWKRANGDRTPVKAPAPSQQQGGCKSCGGK